ncbi:MAG: PAS domain S-box protein, partial [Candidatus Omnitrophica bacterium]|nr:PAS domain S-box protein [Candidatus Omnitrophota bacterium]
MKIGQRIILSFFVIILLVIIVLQIIIHNQKNLVKQYVINDAQHVETVWRTGQNSKVRSLAMALELIINDDVLKGIYLERNKKKLDEYSQPLFKVLRDQYQIDTVKFILPDGHCFLRMHRQNVYGDLVVLPSSLQDKTARDIVSGITIANDNLIYRAYKPYFHNKTLIGYLEIGQYLNSVINDMQYFAGAKTVLCVNKILINERNAQDIKTLDNKLGGIVKFKKFVVVTSTLEKEYALLLDNELEKTIEAASSGLQVISKILHANDQQFAFCAFPLIDIDGQNIGAVLSFLDITPYLRILNKAKTFSLSMIILLCVIVSIIGLRLMSSIIFPLVKLTQTIDQISKGNLDVLFESQTQDEIGILGQSFNNMVKVLKTTTTSIAKLNQEIAERKKIEKILQDETDRAKRYFDITGTMFVALSIKGEITLVNKKSCEILEQTEQEIIGKNWFENFVPNKDEAIKKFNQLLSGEIQSKKYYENDIKTAAGSIRHISWQTSLLRDNTGMIIGIFSSGQDITERMETEQSLKASEENYKNLTQELVQGQEATLNILEDLQEAKGTLEISRQNFLNIVEKSTDSILIVDDKGIVKFANTSATILFGRLLAEIIERPLGLDIIKQGVHETIITYPDGTEKIAAMRAVDTEWEEKTMTLVMLHDMTERKNAENSLRVAAHEWRVTFDSIGYGLSLLDLEGKIVRCNKSQSNFVNKPYAEIIGQDCHELIHDNEAEGLCPIYNTLKTKQRSILVIQKMDKWLSLSVDPLLNEENELIGLVHSVVDLTDQKIIEQKLREYTNYVENIIET